MTYSLQDANRDYQTKLEQINEKLPLYKTMGKQIIEDCSKVSVSGDNEGVEYNPAAAYESTKDGFKESIQQKESLADFKYIDSITYNFKDLPKVCVDAFNAMFKDAGLCELEDADCSVNEYSQRYYDELKANFSGEDASTDL